jgi:tRNA uridine 5-carboxymethylaminomethyl modification enzyme
MTLTGVDGRRFDQPELDVAVADQVEIQVKYAGYIDRQAKEVERHEHYENLALPDDLDYMSVRALSMEVRQKLTRHRPETLGQASRIAGVTPAAISLLLVHLKRGGFKQFVATNDSSDAA